MNTVRNFKVLFAFIIIILVGASYTAFYNLNVLIGDTRLMDETNVVLRTLNELFSEVRDAQSAHRGHELTDRESFLQTYNRTKGRIPAIFARLDTMMADNQLQLSRVDSLRSLVNKQYRIMDEIIENEDPGTQVDQYELNLLKFDESNMSLIRNLINRMYDEELRLLEVRSSHQKYSQRITPIFILTSFIAAIITVIYLFSQLHKALKASIKAENDIEQNLISLSHEITQKDLAQQSLKSVLDTSPNGILFIKSIREDNRIVDFEYVLANKGAARILDMRLDQLVGRRMLEVFPGTKQTGVFDKYVEAVEYGKASHTVYYNEDGLDLWVELAAIKLDDGCVVTFSDITEQKLASDLVKQSRQKFEAIFNQTFQFIGLLNTSGQLLEANRTALNFLGKTIDDLRNKPFWELPWWEASEHSAYDLKLAIQKASAGEFVRYDVDLIGKDNIVYTVDFTLKPVLDEDGNVELLLAEGRDITELKEAEEERAFVIDLNLSIAASDSFEQAVTGTFQKIGDRFGLEYTEAWMVDDQGGLFLSDMYYLGNESYHTLYDEGKQLSDRSEGATFAEIIQTSGQPELIADLNSADTGVLINRRSMAVDMGFTSVFGIPVSFNNEILLIAVFFSKKKIEDVKALTSAIASITISLGALLIKKKTQDEVRKSNALLASAESISKLGSWEWDLKTHKMQWSKGLYEIYGTGEGDFEPDLDYIYNTMHPEDRAGVKSQIDEAIAQSQGYEVEYRVPTDDEQVRYISTLAHPRYDEKQRLTGFFGTVQDITDQKNHEKDLLLKNEALEQSNTNLEQFAYVASHDLQEPLRKIRAFGDRLVTKYSDVLEGKGKDYIDRMQNAAERMQALIDDLLKYSRVARNVEPFKKVALGEVIDGVLSDLETTINEKSAIVNVPELPEIQADRIQLRQLFQNIFSNAIKFIPDDRIPEINVGVDTVKGSQLTNYPDARPNKKYVVLTISDNGIGFDKKYAQKIFDIFERLHGRREFKGTGIGLAICQKVVQNHNGFISADSEEGKGATFTIILPKSNKHD